MPVAILLNHHVNTVKDITILERSNLYGDLAGSTLNKYQSGSNQWNTATWDNGLKHSVAAWNGWTYGWQEFNNPVDLTKFKTIEFTIDQNTEDSSWGQSVGRNAYCGIASSKGASFSKSVTWGTSIGTKTIDISTIKGLYYIKTEVAVNNYARRIRLIRVRLLTT